MDSSKRSQGLKPRKKKAAKPYIPNVDPLLNDFGEWVGGVGFDWQRRASDLSVKEVVDLMWFASRWGYIEGARDTATGKTRLIERAGEAQLVTERQPQFQKKAKVPWETCK